MKSLLFIYKSYIPKETRYKTIYPLWHNNFVMVAKNEEGSNKEINTIGNLIDTEGKIFINEDIKKWVNTQINLLLYICMKKHEIYNIKVSSGELYKTTSPVTVYVIYRNQK